MGSAGSSDMRRSSVTHGSSGEYTIEGAKTVVGRADSSTARAARAFARKKRAGEWSDAPSALKKTTRSVRAGSPARTSRSVATPFSSSIDARGWSRIAAARWMTVFTPRSALRNEAGSERSPSAICTRTRSLPSRRGSRASTRTRSPRAVSRRSTCDPTFPLAPVRRITALEPVPLLLPRIRVVVVVAHLPEAAPVRAHHLELAQELGRLPEVALRHEQPQRRAVVVLERLAGVGVGEQDVVVAQSVERDVGGVAAVGVRHHVAARRLHARAIQHLV